MSADAGRSIVDVLKDIASNIQHLIRSEIRLARTELQDQLIKARGGITLIAAGGILALLGFLFVLLAAVFALALVLPAWAASLIVAIVTAGVGGLLASKGISRLKQVTLPPPRTVASIQETIAWAKNEAR